MGPTMENSRRAENVSLSKELQIRAKGELTACAQAFSIFVEIS
jgi:hypothetical protein